MTAEVDHETRITRARKTLGLGTRATLADVKTAYRQRVKQLHPDKNTATSTNAKEIEDVNEAYEALEAYIADYTYCFDLEEQRQQDPEAFLAQRFQNDWMWGREPRKKREETHKK